MWKYGVEGGTCMCRDLQAGKHHAQPLYLSLLSTHD